MYTHLGTMQSITLSPDCVVTRTSARASAEAPDTVREMAENRVSGVRGKRRTLSNPHQPPSRDVILVSTHLSSPLRAGPADWAHVTSN